MNTRAIGSITFLAGPQSGTTIKVSKAITSIGRDSSNDIVLTDPTASRHHARLVQHNGTWSIEKLAASNTITINGVSIQQSVIGHQDIIGLGSATRFVFLTVAEEQKAASPPSPSAAQGPNQPLAPRRYIPTVIAEPLEEGVASLRISTNTHDEQQFSLLDKPTISIGRNSSNDIVIRERVVSGLHLQIVREGKQFVLVHPHPSRQKTLNGLIYQGRHIQGDESFRKPVLATSFESCPQRVVMQESRPACNKLLLLTGR